MKSISHQQESGGALARWTALVAGALLLVAAAADAERADLHLAPPPVKALDVQLAHPGHGPPPRECAAWPSCAGHADNARLFIRFDPGGPHPQKLPAAIALDLGGGAPVEITRGPGDVYSGAFCLDARALCEIERARSRALAGRVRDVAVFRGREVVRRQPARPVDLAALWQGRRVSLLASVPGCAATDPAKTLFITDQAVIANDARTYTPCGPRDSSGVRQPAGTPLGKWTFGRLAERMAGAGDAKDFVKSWLLQLDPKTPATVNGFPVPARPGLRGAFLVPWCKASVSGASGGSAATCDAHDDATLELDPAKAPFRLLAIVNRIDLADVFAYGAGHPGSAGELRFVFSAEKWNDCNADVRFFVIVEYEVKKSGCGELTQWAKDWLALDGLTGDAYLDKLEALVESVVAQPAGRVRVRTSEVAFVDPATIGLDSEAWSMRQFELENGALVAEPLNRTPDRSFQKPPALALLKTWVETPGNEADIDLDRKEIPPMLPGDVPFAAAVGPMRPSTLSGVGTFWQLPGVGTSAFPDTRHHLSLNTCTACHAGETGTAATHTTPTGPFGSAVKLSSFLTGESVKDPRGQLDANGQVVVREYDDLCRRAEVLSCIAQGFGTPCLCDVTLQRLSMPH